jgi:hypothetical protein
MLDMHDSFNEVCLFLTEADKFMNIRTTIAHVPWQLVYVI